LHEKTQPAHRQVFGLVSLSVRNGISTRHPFPSLTTQWLLTAFVLTHRCGSVPDSHRVPSCDANVGYRIHHQHTDTGQKTTFVSQCQCFLEKLSTHNRNVTLCWVVGTRLLPFVFSAVVLRSGREDRAPLGSDPSARAGVEDGSGLGVLVVSARSFPSLNLKAINPGGAGAGPRLSGTLVSTRVFASAPGGACAGVCPSSTTPPRRTGAAPDGLLTRKPCPISLAMCQWPVYVADIEPNGDRLCYRATGQGITRSGSSDKERGRGLSTGLSRACLLPTPHGTEDLPVPKKTNLKSSGTVVRIRLIKRTVVHFRTYMVPLRFFINLSYMGGDSSILNKFNDLLKSIST